jgi:microcompartment protein CcmL/EutN
MEADLSKGHQGSVCASVDQTCEITKPNLIPFGLKENDEECAVLGSILPTIHENVAKVFPATESSLHEYPRFSEDTVMVQEASNNEIIVTGGSVVKSIFKQCILSSSCQSEFKQVDNRIENQDYLPDGSIPRYVNLEPSLAMDWLEISWDDLRIKERVGAGTFLLLEFTQLWYNKLVSSLDDSKCSFPFNYAGSFGTVHRAEWHGSVSDNNIHFFLSCQICS